MTRFDASPRPSVRYGAAAVIGLAGAVALAGCAATDTADTDTDTGTGAYTDGTYSAEGSYATPESVETIAVTVTLADGVVTDVSVEGDPQKPETAQYQGQFIGGIADVVVGQSIDEVDVSRVAGSSLTSGGFNKAIETIKSDAAA